MPSSLRFHLKFTAAMARACLAFIGILTTHVQAQTSTAIPGHTWVRVAAFTNQPLAGADVAVFSTNGRLLFEHSNATNARGIYPAKIRNLPLDFRVVVTWYGNPQPAPSNLLSLGVVVLSADVQNFDPARDTVYVNPATTLMSALLLLRPHMTLAQAQARVRSFLGMPANASLGAALREEPHFQSAYFSESAFVTDANRHGGFLLYVATLLNEMLGNPKTVHRFPGALQSSSGGAASFIAENLAKGALSWAAGQGLGWVAKSAGLVTPGATAEQIAQLQASLDALQSSVDQLSTQLAAATQAILDELTKTQYNTIATQALALAAKVNVAADNLAYYADGCPPLPENGATESVGAVSTDWCASQKQLVTSQLSDIEINGSYETLANWLLDTQTVGFKGMIHLFSQSTGASVRFFRPADSAKVQAMFDYWDAVETQAANLKVELWHLNDALDNPGGRKQITDFLGDPDLQPPSTGSFQATNAAEVHLMFPPVPDGTVFDTKTKAMWATGIPKLYAYQIGDQIYTSCPSEWQPPYTPDPAVYGFSGGPSFGQNFNGVSGWTSPTVSQLQALIDGWSGTSPMSWLIAQSQSTDPSFPASPGFFDILACSLGNFYTFVWTTTNQGSAPFYSPYALINMLNGQIPAKNTYPYGGLNWLILTRPLAPGEQYYWYP